jgi:hypothetical protein
MVVAVLVVVFNLFGLPYKGLYDNFLIIVSFVFNASIVWYAWTWSLQLPSHGLVCLDFDSVCLSASTLGSTTGRRIRR